MAAWRYPCLDCGRPTESEAKWVNWCVSVLVDWLRATLPRRTFSRMDSADAVQISDLGLALVTWR
jgi:hypothetical protein